MVMHAQIDPFCTSCLSGSLIISDAPKAKGDHKQDYDQPISQLVPAPKHPPRKGGELQPASKVYGHRDDSRPVMKGTEMHHRPFSQASVGYHPEQ